MTAKKTYVIDKATTVKAKFIIGRYHAKTPQKIILINSN